MKQLIILSFLFTTFFSLFAQQDTSITVRSYKTGDGKTYITRDTIVRGYKLKSLTLKKDSLIFKNNRFQKVFSDTNRMYKIYSDYDFVNNDTLSKEITTEVSCNPDATIFIENVNRKLIIKTSADNKVRIVTTVNFSVDPKITDTEWFQKLNLELKSNNNQVVLKSDNLNNGTEKIARTFTATEQTTGGGLRTLQYSYGNNTIMEIKSDSIATLNGNLNLTNRRIITPKIITIYIPVNAKLDVESKYSDVEIQNDLKNLKADITNASLRFMNVETADIQSKYGRINAGNIKKADVTLTNGKFYAKDIYSGKFDSKYSNIEFGVSNNLKLESINDQYEIDGVTDLIGKKNYGSLRITNLKNSIDLTGNNADIKIRDIAATVTAIKIDDKYADIRLPVNNLTNYTVDFDGKNCNVFAPFDKVIVLKVDEVKKDDIKKADPVYKINTAPGFKSLSPLNKTGGYFITSDGKDNSFKSSVGDVKEKHAELQFKCISCTVDFK